MDAATGAISPNSAAVSSAIGSSAATAGTSTSTDGSNAVALAFSIAGQPIVQLPYRRGSFSLDLSSPGEASVDSAVSVDSQVVTTDPCRDAPMVPLKDLALIAVGQPIPARTFADFFPRVLDRLIIRVNAIDVDQPGVAQAVIDMVAFASHRWPAARVVVTNRDLDVSPFDRKVEFRRSEKRSISLETNNAGTALVLSSTSADAAGLVAFVSSSQFEASFLSRAEAGALPRISSRSAAGEPFVSVSDIRSSAVAAGLGEATVSLELDQSRFGGQMSSITATVNGVARSTGSESVTVQLRANNRILATKRVGNDEAFELTGSLAIPSLTAKNVFEVRASDLGGPNLAAGASAATAGVCPLGFKQPTVSVELDPTSAFEGTPGVGVSGGFDRFPQAFANGFDIRMARRGMGELVGAASIVELLQHQSPIRLRGRIIADTSSAVELFTRPTLYVSTRGSVLGAAGSASDSPAAALAALLAGADLQPEAKAAKSTSTETGSVAIKASKASTTMATASQNTQNTTAPSRVTSAALGAIESGGADHLVLVAEDDMGIPQLFVATSEDRRGLRALRGDLLIAHDGVVKNLRMHTDSKPAVVRRVLAAQPRVAYPMWFGFIAGGLIALFVVTSRHRNGHS